MENQLELISAKEGCAGRGPALQGRAGNRAAGSEGALGEVFPLSSVCVCSVLALPGRAPVSVPTGSVFRDNLALVRVCHQNPGQDLSQPGPLGMGVCGSGTAPHPPAI